MKALVAAAVLPAVLLMIYVYRKDKVEKEPANLIIKLVIFGGLTVISAIILELFGSWVLGKFYDDGELTYKLVENFIVVAGVEEGGKYFVLKRKTWNSPEFNYSYDAVVYSVAVSLGFATIENILYVLTGGFTVAVVRALLSVPGHAVFAVYMGYYYGVAKKASVNGRISAEETNRTMAYIVPVILHGFYDFCLSMDSGKFVGIFLLFDVLMVISAAKKVNKLSENDAPLAEQPYYNEYM